ncbi:MAG TPA: hypothetical protein DCP08_02725, partial [Chloroflexi bacterium]|nr:hypothetical protein [Chloroflexota bacterium]
MKRKVLVYTALLVSLLAAVISIGVAHSGPGPAPRADPESGPLPVGVQMLGEQNNDTAVSRAEEAGANWARITLLWSSIESTPGSYNWSSSFDEALNRLAAQGLTPIVEVRSSPAWAHEETGQDCGPIDGPITDPFEPPTPGPPIPSPGPFSTYLPLVMKSYPPTDLDRFQYFVSALVERYDGDGVNDGPGSPEVKYWEFWNEPDNKSLSPSCIFVGGCWGGDLDHDGIPDPVEYVAMLKRAYTAVKASDPEAQVVFGGIAYETIPEGCFNTNFLDQVLTNGGGAYFDLMNFHQYDFKRDVWDGTLPYQQGIIGKATYIKNKLASYELSKPLVCSEIGLSSDRSAGQNELQARHLVHEFVRGMSMWPDDIKAIIWFTLGEYGSASAYYGLLDAGYKPYPAHDAYRVMTSQLEGAGFEHQLAPDETGNSWIQAYRFFTESGKVLVLWTDSGEKIKAQPDRKVDMAIGQSQLNDTWISQLRVVDLYGNVTTV